MNTSFNAALKQSTSIRRDIAALSGPDALTPAAMGAVSASLTSFSRTLDEYAHLARQELNPSKKEKAEERVRNFRQELADFRSEFESLKELRDAQVHAGNRTELLGRRPYTQTPENPYANTSKTMSSDGGPYRGSPQTQAILSMGSGEEQREAHALREQNFFASTNSALDDYIARGQAVLGNLGEQREIMKGTQKRLYNAANTLGVSGDTIRMIERRAREDKWIFGVCVVVFFLFCWAVLHFLR